VSEPLKTYTVHDPHQDYQTGYNYHHRPIEPGGWILMIITVFIIGWVIFYKLMNWWDNLGMPYAYNRGPNDKYYDYNNSNTSILTGVNDQYDNEQKAKPQAKKWVNHLYKPKPVVPPRMFVAGRMNGKPFQMEGEPELNGLTWAEKNRYCEQNHIYGAKRKKLMNETEDEDIFS